ncbi:Uncharacterised protein [Candidatus Bilamarchaeum dharawalense]|uniref:DUF2207 domain-containing protein n=1 Tax=Candidatus Bilamarchaeum dharawalense TaxID=2885759 RepID=A0A5E4LSN3_9ARCH|nr:Uncharacterised protein [Candidatus Bilamarchaeum dharawalense]
MKSGVILFILIFLAASVWAFSIDSYDNHVEILTNGDVRVQENINFTLEQQYNEGFRDIRKEDYGDLDNLVVESVKVNGETVPHTKQLYKDKAEIAWQKTFTGHNAVELIYVLKDRAQLYDDFAKICIEHYGAGWSVPATKFHSEMKLPEASRSKDMHFEIYSEKKGDARINDLTIEVDMENVPPGNYIGGCYLYDKGALQTNNRVNGSAYAMLADERKLYGSEAIVVPVVLPPLSLICLPVSLIVAGIAFYAYNNEKKQPRYPENILPPDREEPAVVSMLIRNSVPRADMMAATILDLINKNVLDIVELENKGESSTEVKKERTVLILKKRPKNLSEKETIIIDMIFNGGNTEVDLDQMARDFDAIKTKQDAEKNTISVGIEKFDRVITRILNDRGISSSNTAFYVKWLIFVALILVAPFALCPVSFMVFAWVLGLMANGNYLEIGALVLAGIILVGSLLYLASLILKPAIPKGKEDEYAKWDGFARAVKSSRLKEYPPESVLIWGEILVYATAIGLADKVKQHLSELNKLILTKIDKMDRIRLSSHHFYNSAMALNSLRKYGTRNRGNGGGRHGGFSSHSSGGWSSHGGGGFSHHSSGGGGFR